MKDLSQVLFVGGDKGWGSCQVRVFDIAPKLVVNFIAPAPPVENIAPHYCAFVMVKANYSVSDLNKLRSRKKGRLVWDGIDSPPPEGVPIDVYLTRSEAMAQRLEARGRVEVIPHHHCNVNRLRPTADCRRLVYVGIRRWCPTLAETDLEFEARTPEGLNSDTTVMLYQNAGIMFNLRCKKDEEYEQHLRWGAGIKLINSIGFGLPSISNDEPAYREIDAQAGGGTTFFASTPEEVKAAYQQLLDPEIYGKMQAKCLAVADQWHVNAIAQKYLKLLQSL